MRRAEIAVHDRLDRRRAMPAGVGDMLFFALRQRPRERRLDQIGARLKMAVKAAMGEIDRFHEFADTDAVQAEFPDAHRSGA